MSGRIGIHRDLRQTNQFTQMREIAAANPGRVLAILQQENQLSQDNPQFIPNLDALVTPYVAFCEGDDRWIDDVKLERQWRFMQRNRLLAAASGATVVVEAGSRSGSLHVAANAARLGREVAAFPGPVTSANSAGTHLLIADGVAQLVTSATDIRQLIDGGTSDGPSPIGGIGSVPRIDQVRSRNLASRSDAAERSGIAI